MTYFARRDPEDDPGDLADSISARNRATGAVCEAWERRIHPVIEAPPGQLVDVERRYRVSKAAIQLDRRAYAAYLRLKAAAEADGIAPALLRVVSGYRTVADQREIWARALRRYGTAKEAVHWVARPGGSPHHTGRAIDFALGTSNNSKNVARLRETPAYQWLVCNAGRFGFTPYAREPWHWEYNPPELATAPGTDRPVPPHPANGARGPQASRAPRARAGTPAPMRAAGVAGGIPGFTAPEEKALRITTAFETGRPLDFGGLTGNFDGQGLSFGLLQWNVGTGSLQPLLREFASAAPARFDAVFGAQAPSLRALLAPGRSVADQLQWARSINDPAQRRIVEPWKTAFERLAAEPDFRAIQLRAVRPRMDAAERNARQLGILGERGLALLFDNVTQNGPGWLHPQRLAAIRQRAAEARAARGQGVNERELLAIVANVVADTAHPRWREDVRRRRMTIVNGTGVVHRTPFDLGRQFGLTDAPWDAAHPGGARQMAS
jgi:hypothetical protein